MFDLCPNTPVISRTQFDPKRGVAPFDVVFNVTAEDPDTKTCGESLLYHWDFNGDNIEDRTTKSGQRIVHRFKDGGNFKVRIWVTDGAGHKSKVVEKFVEALPNKPPVIVSLSATPRQFILNEYNPTFTLIAYDPDVGTSNGAGIARVLFDWGDGTPPGLFTSFVSSAYHTYAQPGDYTVTATVYDTYNAQDQAAVKVSATIKIGATNYVPTAATSHAIVFDDNAGARYFDAAKGDWVEYAYVADGPIALKSFRYWGKSYVTGSTAQKVELLGVVDPGFGGKNMTSIARYGPLVAVAGKGGMMVFNANTDPARRCAPGQTSGCFPGTPTQPVPLCAVDYDAIHFGNNLTQVRLVEPWGLGMAFFVAAAGPLNTGRLGEIYLLRADMAAASPASYQQLVSACWNVPSVVNFSIVAGGLDYGVNDFVLDETHHFAFFSTQNGGLQVLDVATVISACSSTGCPENLANFVRPYYSGYSAYGVTYLPPKLMTQASVEFQPVILSAPRPYHDPVPVPVTWGKVDCNDYRTLVTTGVQGKRLLTEKPILPANRIAIRYWVDYGINGINGYRWDDTNSGMGYAVTGVTGNDTWLSAPPTYGNPVTLTPIAAYPLAVSYAILPSYPGQATAMSALDFGRSDLAIARSYTCRNVLYAYAPQAPLTVTYTAAPLLLVGVTRFGDSGIKVLDAADPWNMVELDTIYGVPNLQVGLRGWERFVFTVANTVEVIDARDPYHAYEAYAAIPEQDFNFYAFIGSNARGADLRDLVVRQPPEKPDGVLIAAVGPLGLAAMDVIPRLTNRTAHACGNSYNDSACMDSVAGLILQHEGKPTDIKIIGSSYAVAGLRYGGIMTFDISDVASGGQPRFLSHIPMDRKGETTMLRVVTEPTSGVARALLVADTTAVWRIPFTNPTYPDLGGASMYGLDGALYICVESAGGYTFACRVSGTARQLLFASADTTLFAPIDFRRSDHVFYCIPGPDTFNETYRAVFADVIAGRNILFTDVADIGYLYQEVNFNTGQGCMWRFGLIANGSGPFTYQKRSSVWRRAYLGGAGGTVQIYDLVPLAQMLETQPPNATMDQSPPLMGSIQLRNEEPNHPSYPAIGQLSAVGPYLFVAAGQDGVWVLDVENPADIGIIGRTRILGTQSYDTNAYMITATAFPWPPNQTQTYTYLALVADWENGGIRLLRFDGLRPP